MNNTDSKKAVRHTVLAKLRSIPGHIRHQYSATLRAQLSDLLSVPSPLTVGIYIPMQHEVDLQPLLTEYPQHRYAAPRCLPGRQLIFHHIRDIQQDTIPGAHGIPAPREELPAVEPNEFDILIIPGVAFTHEGLRLGYGGGYYDRYIPRCTHARLVALAFREQMLPTLPTDEHDITIPHIIHL
ncbi:MAG: 5-formyltetrahydrofolate cyclo-ligase [Akkermansia sp.]|nr:5-formyltetrahydrofolate cyclo-ligase [Akkermansia sp.]